MYCNNGPYMSDVCAKGILGHFAKYCREGQGHDITKDRRRPPGKFARSNHGPAVASVCFTASPPTFTIFSLLLLIGFIRETNPSYAALLMADLVAVDSHSKLSSSSARLCLTTRSPFTPSTKHTGEPPCFSKGGRSPVFFGSARFANGIHPCKIVPHRRNPCQIPYGGSEYPLPKNGPNMYTLLPFNPDTMELVPTSHGRLPMGRRPVDGGYEEYGARLYHAVATWHGETVPGKTGTHLVRRPCIFI